MEKHNNVAAKSSNFLPQMEKNEVCFLILSPYYEYKNFEILNRINPLIQKNKRSNIHFVATLPEVIFDEIFTEKSRKDIINVGPIKPDDCP